MVISSRQQLRAGRRVPLPERIPLLLGSTNVACPGHGGHMDRSPEVEQLAMAWLAGMKAADAVAVASLFVESEATTVVGNGADQWFTGDAYTRKRLDNSISENGGIPFEPGSPIGWAQGDT